MLHLNGDDLRPINDLIVAIFRVSGGLLEGGSRLVEDIGLTPAWWQVLGALALSPAPLTVPQIARNMGLTRQSVQRIVDLLVVKEFLRSEPNPNHRRARLVALSDKGEQIYLKAQNLQQPWSIELESGLSPQDIQTAIKVIKALDAKLSEQKMEQAR